MVQESKNRIHRLKNNRIRSHTDIQVLALYVSLKNLDLLTHSFTLLTNSITDVVTVPGEQNHE